MQPTTYTLKALIIDNPRRGQASGAAGAGGAKVILATAPSGKAMGAVLGVWLLTGNLSS
ncbi:MAG TPA: hypothetical protein VFJ51_07060 [Nitrososphaeraceae archaeon]|nr:hypothetical protein [Nitrososphaeraceae archaeon]